MDYDLIVIGSGPSGRAAAIQAGKLKRKVLVIDRKSRLGGVSVHTGTIPSKTLRETVLNLTGWRERSFYGRSYRVKDAIAAEDLKARLHKTLDYEVDVLEHQFNRNYVETLNGFARFEDKNTLCVDTEAGDTLRVTAHKFVIATGTKTFRPDWIPFNGKTIVDSDDFLEIDHLPRSLTVIGAGVIGVEYATMFAALDIRVTLIEPRDSFLDFVDNATIREFAHHIGENGVDLRLGSAVEQVEDAGDHVEVSLDNGRHVRSEMLLFAAGRMGATDRLNLDAIDLKTDHRGRIEVDRANYQICSKCLCDGGCDWSRALRQPQCSRGASRPVMRLKRPRCPKAHGFPMAFIRCPKFPPVGCPKRICRNVRLPMKLVSRGFVKPLVVTLRVLNTVC